MAPYTHGANTSEETTEASGNEQGPDFQRDESLTRETSERKKHVCV